MLRLLSDMSPDPAPPISVVIRCFNEEKHIGNLLENLQGQTRKNHEVLVVDSGSTDRTLDIARSFGAGIVHIDPEHFTFGRSLNTGCAAAKGSILVFASAHVLPIGNDWLMEMIAPFADQSVGLVYGRQIGDSTTKFSEHQVFARQFPGESNYDQQTPFCNNASCAIRRDLWLQRPYDERLTGLEDLEWAKWLLSTGRKIVYNAQATIVHIHNERPAKIFTRYEREAIALKRIFPDSHMTLIEFLGLWSANVFLDLLRALKQRKFLQCFAEILVFRTMQYWGTFRGFHFRARITEEVIAQFYYPRPPRTFTGQK